MSDSPYTAEAAQPDAAPQAASAGISRAVFYGLISAASAAILYSFTMAPGMLWGDSGDAQIRVLAGRLSDSRELARAHVAYYLAAVGIHNAFGVDAARAANMVAVIGGVGTVGFFAALVSLFVRRKVAIASGVLLLACSHTLWQMSTRAEVVSMSTMWLAAELFFCVRFLRSGRYEFVVLTALANGLGFSTHNMALLIWPAYMALALVNLPRFRKQHVAPFLAAIAAWMVGASPILLLLIQEASRSGIGGALQSLTVGSYADDVFNVIVTPALLLRVLGYVVMNFPTPLILLAGWGLSRRLRRPAYGVWTALSVGGACYLVFAARYSVPDQYTFQVHWFMFLVLFAAVGVDLLLAKWRSKAVAAAVIVLSLTAPPLYAAAPIVARRYFSQWLPLPKRVIPHRDPYKWFLWPWTTGYHGAERYAREVFETLPEGTAYFVDSTTRMPFEYLQAAESLRRDVQLPYVWRRWDWATAADFSPDNVTKMLAEGRIFSADTDRRYPQALGFEPEDCSFNAVGRVYRIDCVGQPRLPSGSNELDESTRRKPSKRDKAPGNP